MNKCADCVFWSCLEYDKANGQPTTGACRRYAPKPELGDQHPRHMGQMACWPATWPKDWCGEFVPTIANAPKAKH